jgi:hypothetical protein
LQGREASATNTLTAVNNADYKRLPQARIEQPTLIKNLCE